MWGGEPIRLPRYHSDKEGVFVMNWNAATPRTLQRYGVDERWDVVLDPDRVFWALVGKDARQAQDEASALHARVAEELESRLREFRFGTHVTALYVNPNDACHADCRYCYIPPEIRRNGPRMTKEQLGLVLDKAAAYFSRQELGDRKPVIIFHGSEPLVVKDLVFWAIREYGETFAFGLQTDGVLLTEEDIAFLKEKRVSVGISLDSHDPKVHSYLRRVPGQDGGFERTVRAIEAFDGYAGLNVVTTITRHNVQDLPDLVTFLHERKVQVAMMNPVRGTQPYSQSFRPDCDTLLEMFTRAVRRTLDLSERSGRPILIGDFSNLVLAIVAPEGRRLMCDITPCGGARCFFTITAGGEMVPCGEFQGLDGFSGGNIFRDSIEDAVASRPFQQVRERTVERIEECRDCAIRHICGAPCPAEMQGASGDMLLPSPYCGFYKGIVRVAFQLIAEGKIRRLVRDMAINQLQVDYCVVR
ncbi:MAG: peptide-modifying radical SAM enzyme CbpB [Chloroflexota bacterium]|nr:MAG: peptide-modifying radical SAM enzyme CbpB [Chloroflexota bacterium]